MQTQIGSNLPHIRSNGKYQILFIFNILILRECFCHVLDVKIFKPISVVGYHQVTSDIEAKNYLVHFSIPFPSVIFPLET